MNYYCIYVYITFNIEIDPSKIEGKVKGLLNRNLIVVKADEQNITEQQNRKLNNL